MTKRLPTVEGLESRNLFSLSTLPMTAPMIYADLSARDEVRPAAQPAQPAQTKPAKSALAAAAAKKKKPTVKPPTLLGEWDGRFTVKAWPFKIRYDVDLEIYSISRDTRIIHGELVIDDDDYSGRWTGLTYSKTGDFKYTLRKHGDKITIEGNISPNSKFASGKITIDWDHGGKTKGDLTLNKWR